MYGVFFAMQAMFFHFQSIFQCFFVFIGKIIGALTFRAFQFNHVVGIF